MMYNGHGESQDRPHVFLSSTFLRYTSRVPVDIDSQSDGVTFSKKFKVGH